MSLLEINTIVTKYYKEDFLFGLLSINTKPKIEEVYHNNKLVKKYWYFYDGTIGKEKTYDGDVLEGEYNYFYRNSNIMIEGHYIKGRKTGEWNQYSSNGDLITKGIYKNNKQIDGKFIKYRDENEQPYHRGLVSICEYKNGEMLHSAVIDCLTKTFISQYICGCNKVTITTKYYHQEADGHATHVIISDGNKGLYQKYRANGDIYGQGYKLSDNKLRNTKIKRRSQLYEFTKPNEIIEDTSYNKIKVCKYFDDFLDLAKTINND